MKIQPFSLDQLPPSVPMWDVMLDDLARQAPERIARVLGVGRSTVYRWNHTGDAPRVAYLALFRVRPLTRRPSTTRLWPLRWPAASCASKTSCRRN
jgi:hypothetical protein